MKQPMVQSYWQEEINKSKNYHVLSLNKKAIEFNMSVFCSKTLIFAPKCWKCILRGPDLKKFLGGGGEHAPRQP